MFRALAFLYLLPAPALAEWAPSPRAFSYEASFARCTADPARVDVADCADIFRNAYDLNRAVVQAVQTCDTPNLAECPENFENLGLPAIAARIALDAECDATPTIGFAPFKPLPPTHCITTIADILRDEGVVPVIDDLPCDGAESDCHILREVHAAYWFQSVTGLSNSNLTRTRLDASWNGCSDVTDNETALMECHIAGLADIWADLAQNGMQDN